MALSFMGADIKLRGGMLSLTRVEGRISSTLVLCRAELEWVLKEWESGAVVGPCRLLTAYYPSDPELELKLAGPRGDCGIAHRGLYFYLPAELIALIKADLQGEG